MAFDANGALDLLRRGNAPAARAAAETALNADKTTPGAHQVLGLAALQMGDAAAAAPALKAALTADPSQPGLWEIYGGALEASNDHAGALQAYDEAVRLAPENASGHRLRGIALQQLKRNTDAAQALRTAVHLDANDAEAWFWLGNAHYASAAYDEAVNAFQTALKLRPQWTDALLNLAVVLADVGQHEAALQTYQKAMDLSPDNPLILRHVAITLRELQHVDEAERLFKQALDLDPDDAVTAAALADMYEQVNRLEDAGEMAARAIDIDPENAQAQKVHAMLARRGGDTDAALESVLHLLDRASSRLELESLTFERARLHDRLGDVDDAYSAFAEANRLQMEGPAGQRSNPQTYRAQVARELEIWNTAPPEHEDAAAWSGAPIFLMGFPRSGTTLLDQVLDGHDDIAVMEERPPLAEVYDRLTALENQAGKPFTRLDRDQRRAAQEFYFTRAKSFLPAYTGGLLIDKHPLATAKVRTIKLLFPDAKIIFALRHPCDVVLSCFMQRFVMNMAMANFTTVEGAAALYAQVMQVWRAAEPKLDLPVHRIRYEDVVQDFEAQIKSPVAFIGVPWDDALINFHEHAQQRHVRTASYAQVTQPLYTSALARWQKYADYISPHLDTLRPHLEEFGYSANISKGN